jgi:hypothetical protein
MVLKVYLGKRKINNNIYLNSNLESRKNGYLKNKKATITRSLFYLILKFTLLQFFGYNLNFPLVVLIHKLQLINYLN